MTALEHTVRNSLMDKVHTYTLREDALVVHGGPDDREMAYADVREIRLISYASPGGEVAQATLKDKHGGKIKIRSYHYVSLGNFEDRRPSYGPFMRELLQRIAGRAPDARFIAGSSSIFLLWLLVAVLWAGALFLMLAGFVENPGQNNKYLGGMVTCVVIAPFIWNYLRRGGQKTFDPQNPPPRLVGI